MNPHRSRSRRAHALVSALAATRLWRAILLGLIGVVCFLALSPNPPQHVSTGWDKLNHAAAFAAMTLAGCLAFPDSRRTVFALLVAMLAFGGLIEVLQLLVPGRSSEWEDIVADALGIVCGAAVATPLVWFVHKRGRQRA